MVGLVHDEGGEGYAVIQERWKAPPNLLCLNVKVSPSQFKVLKQCGQFEAKLMVSDGSMRPIELQDCRLVKHDQGRGHWTFLAWVCSLPDPGTTVRLQMMPKGGDS